MTSTEDEMVILFDRLPQPSRFLNKLLLHHVGDAIDLAEVGGSAESLDSVISHNLRLAARIRHKRV
jgi:hypothetical protein